MIKKNGKKIIGIPAGVCDELANIEELINNSAKQFGGAKKILALERNGRADYYAIHLLVSGHVITYGIDNNDGKEIFKKMKEFGKLFGMKIYPHLLYAPMDKYMLAMIKKKFEDD